MNALEADVSLKAHVENGQIVLDEPVHLPEGATLEVRLADGGEMSVAERAELEAAIDEGVEDFERGDFEDAHEFALRLATKP